MVASMSEGLVRLAVDSATSSVLRRPSSGGAQFGDWELVAQLQVGSGRGNGSADPGLRVHGRAISEAHMDAIDETCNRAAQATKIQRYDSSVDFPILLLSCATILFGSLRRWWAFVRRLRAKKARRRLRSLLGMPTSPCSRHSNC